MICHERNREDKEDSRKSETPTPEVDEDGFCIRPKPDPWENEKGFYSSSDTDSEDERERKIRVEIKPLSNGGAPMSASVDELRATVENLSLSPAPTVSLYSLLKNHVCYTSWFTTQITDIPWFIFHEQFLSWSHYNFRNAQLYVIRKKNSFRFSDDTSCLNRDVEDRIPIPIITWKGLSQCHSN